ncbi:hypothetical protein TorRG33x02_002230 [Trema orientale]|uniref:Uncharacterized protein n=1 Tax=Trema orientale TaxID=63057 RepID=A0A2P5G1L8_TREOI|nr:hypothetical protein TorRG33x02_002230 [Trema orientale]
MRQEHHFRTRDSANGRQPHHSPIPISDQAQVNHVVDTWMIDSCGWHYSLGRIIILIVIAGKNN